MAEAHLDHPGDVTWFKGYGPLRVLGPCPHDCEHSDMRTIAWGPDYEHYELVACSCGCRGWFGQWPPHRSDGVRYRLPRKWLHVAAPVDPQHPANTVTLPAPDLGGTA